MCLDAFLAVGLHYLATSLPLDWVYFFANVSHKVKEVQLEW